MAFNTNEFINSFKERQGSTAITASPAMFNVQFLHFPAIMEKKVTDPIKKARLLNTFNNLRLRASTADLPARQLISVQRAFNGPHKLVPYSSVYASMIIEFIETPDYDIRAFFDTWHQLIEGNQRGFSTAYYEDIICNEFTVNTFNKFGDPTQVWKFTNAFPVSVNPSQMNWSTQNGIVTVAVEMSYHRWEFSQITQSEIDKKRKNATASTNSSSSKNKDVIIKEGTNIVKKLING